MPRRLAVALCAVLGVALAGGPAGGTTRPQVTDPAGDAAFGEPSGDITSVTFSVTRAAAGPRDLVVSVGYAGPAEVGPGTAHLLRVDTPCGVLTLRSYLGPTGRVATDGAFSDCGTPVDNGVQQSRRHFLPVRAEVAGNGLVWRVAFSAMPRRKIRVGGSWSAPRMTTSLGEPATGVSTVEALEDYSDDAARDTAIDVATNPGAFRLGA